MATPLMWRSDGEKITLGSFLFRDDCYTLLTRLVNVSSSISRLNGGSPPPLVGELWPASPSRSRSSRSFDVDDEPRDEDAPPEPSESSPGVAIPGALTASNHPGSGTFETMVDVVFPCTVAQVCAPSLSYHVRQVVTGGHAPLLWLRVLVFIFFRPVRV